MNTYTYDELQIGMEQGFEVTVTRKMQEAFAELTGDVNPLHTDADYAEDCGYGGIVCYGMLTASFFSTLIGMYLPGKYALFQECHSYFNRPVYIGDTLRIQGKIIEKSDAEKRITIKVIVKNQKGEKVSLAKLVGGVLR